MAQEEKKKIDSEMEKVFTGKTELQEADFEALSADVFKVPKIF